MFERGCESPPYTGRVRPPIRGRTQASARVSRRVELAQRGGDEVPPQHGAQVAAGRGRLVKRGVGHRGGRVQSSDTLPTRTRIGSGGWFDAGENAHDGLDNWRGRPKSQG